MLFPSFSDGNDHFQGFPDAPIEILQYGDFQCVHCGVVYSSLRLLKQQLGDQLKVVFRHFPQINLHALALEAAIAAEAASTQGKFWEMHDLIYELQAYLVKSSFSKFAEAIELNLYEFENSRANKHIKNKIINDFERGVKSGVNGTPTFFINGRRYNGFDDFESLYKTCKFVSDYNSIAL